MTTSTGFSLWLQPTGQAYDRLAGIIQQLSAQYRAPVFEPHVTLIGGSTGDTESLIAKTTQLEKSLQPFTINLTTLDYLDEYFRCLFVRAEKSESLINANSKSRDVFNLAQSKEYMPHLSLMYGDFPPATKQRIISEIGSELDVSFQVVSLHLVATSGKPNDWCKVKEYKFR